MLRKYPSTYHLPWSRGISRTGDRVLSNASHFDNKTVVVTEKMDGENTTMYRSGHCHARSLDSAYHESRSYVRQLAGNVGHMIPEGWRVCGENMYAKHSISYNNLENYFLVFSVWDENNRCLTWDETVEFCNTLGLKTVPVLYRGTWTDKVRADLLSSINERTTEGYVVRVDEKFDFCNFSSNVAKYVRKNHVQTTEHWMTQQIVKNVCRID